MKKALATLLAFAMIVTGFLCLNPNASEVKAATTTSEHGTFKAVPKTEWKEDNDGVPELDGYLFAGYYKDEDCAKANRASKGNATHAKFVSDDMLDVKAQVTNGMVSVSDVEAYEGKYVIRFVSSVESLNYKNIGFELEYTNDEGEVVKLRNTTSKVFKRIESTTGAANGEIDEYSFSPKVVGEDSEYFMTAKLPVDVEDKAVTYKVRAFWTTFDGTEVMGKTRCVSVNDGNNDIVNMVAEANAQLKEGADYTATYGPNADGTGADAAKVEVLSSDANGYTNIRVTLASGTTATGLKSATKFIIKDAEGNQVATAVYRNYYTDKAGTADTSWWDVNPTATRFEIASVSDLYGLASIVNGKKDLFYQNEIHLVRSVEVNDGIAIPASETSDGVAKWQSDTTPVAWTPIGSGWNADFRGIFDGDNNTISGLYMSGGSSFVGLFGYAGINNGQNAEIANVRLTNSYFSTSYDNVGSIISYGYGVQRLENVYSDAILVASTATGNVGGLVGRLSIPDKTIKSGDDKAALDGPHMLYKNCWFDGEINSSSTGAVNIGGIMGALNNTYRLDMINCLYTGTINNASTSAYVGGLFSRNVNPMWMELTNCLSTGEFNVATNAKGGLFATAQHPTLGWLEMNNCYTSASKAWNVNGYTAYTAADCQKISAELAAADVDTLFSGHNGAWVNDVEDAQTPILSSFASWWNEKQYEAGLDTSWYDPDATEYVITTASQLRGLSELSQTNNFAGKTIKLGADIAMNKADSAIVKKWAKGTAIPENSWTPICRTNEFAGTFDGQGYAVSGLYYNGDAWNIGFIGSTAEGSVIKNIKVVDSYLKSSGGYVGGVVGLNKSTTLENLYSNAIVDCTYGQGGGIVGCQYGAKGGSTDDYFTNGTGTKWNIKNVWFDGEVVSYSGKNYYGGIVGCLPNQIILVVDNALFTGKITGTGANLVGGIIGGNNNASTVTLNNCLALGSIQDGAGSAAALYGKVNSSYTKLFVNHSYTTITNYNTIASPYNYGSLTTSEGLVILQTRDALISANEDTLLPMLEGETENAWVSDNATGWNNTDRGTPILATFAEWWIANVEHDELTVDFSWYNDNDTEFILYDAADLKGLAHIVNNTDEQFAEKTIKLGANIQVNKVNDEIFTSWKAETAFGDEWTPIGTDAKPFAGTFDGQEYEISGLYYNGTKYYIGLFGKTTQQSVLRNVRVVDSYFKTSGNAVGAIAGAGDSLIMENLYSNAYVYGTTGVSGGLIGRISGAVGGAYGDYYTNGTGTKWTVRNAWFDGELQVPSVEKYYFGGIVGQLPNPIVLSIENCLFTGRITGGTGAKFVGGIVGGNNSYLTCKMYNCLSVGTMETGAASGSALYGYFNSSRSKLYVYDSYTTITNYNSVASITNATYQIVETADDIVKTRTQLINAEATALFPALAGETKSAWVNDIGYNATDRGTPILASFAEWWLARQPETELAERADTSWYNDNDTEFILDSAAELYGFATLGQTNSFEGKTIKLGKDIALNIVNADTVEAWKDGTVPDGKWTPVGTSSVPFAGIFDGQGHTISGLYLDGTTKTGFFGEVTNAAIIKNFKFVDSYMKSSGSYLGLIGYGLPQLIDSVYSNATMVPGGAYVGGFVGAYQSSVGTGTAPSDWEAAGAAMTINNCWFDGTITGGTSVHSIGGFIGTQATRAKIVISNCLYTGHISTEAATARAGGFYGWLNYTGKNPFENSLSVGTITTNGANVGALIGQSGVTASTVTTTNVYAIGDAACGNNTTWNSVLKNRDAICGADVSTLFTSDVWANDNENGWNDTDRGTPILATFADFWRARQPELVYTVDTSWYNDIDDEFTLYDLADVRGFVAIANNKDDFAGKTVKLGADIVVNTPNVVAWEEGNAVADFNWTPIGTTAKPFAGTFDGQGNTISGLYLNVTTTDPTGMFGSTTGVAEIKNFKLVDSYMKTTGGRLGIVGRGTVAKIENVYTNAIMANETGHAVGGMIGELVPVNGTTVATFNSCWFDGSLTGGGEIAGGIVGNITAQATLEFNNCLNTGSISCNKRAGGLVGYINNGWYVAGSGWQTNKWVFNNCLSVGDVQSTGSDATWSVAGELVAAINTNAVSLTLNDTYAVGSPAVGYYGGSTTAATKAIFEAATVLKNRQEVVDAGVLLFPTSDAWVNDIGYNDTDRGIPMLKYFAEFWLKRNPAEGLKATPDVTWYDADEKEFTLTTAAQMYGFAQLAKVYNFEGKTVKLGTNITLNEVDETILTKWENSSAIGRTWTPVGTATNPFAGTFDGQGYEVSGLYLNTTANAAGFFGTTAATANLTNFKLIDSYMKSTGNQFGLIGDGTFAKIEKVYTNAIMNVEGNHVGGFIGRASGSGAEMLISNCWFDGTIIQTADTTNSKGTQGGVSGFVGMTAEITGTRPIFVAQNCLNTGDLSGYTRVGGFIGWNAYGNKEQSCTWTNCLMVGSVASDNASATKGMFVGDYSTSGLTTITSSYTTGSVVVGGESASKATCNQDAVKTREDLYLTDLATLFPGSDAWVQDTGYNDTDRGTPILATFAEWWTGRQDEGAIEAAPSTAWYTAPETDGEYIIQNKGDLLGFLSLAKKGETFDGKTIKLGANITLNTPNVNDWKAGKNLPAYQWIPVTFNGNFDGQGHSISGIYVKSNSAAVGFFGKTAAGSSISNFRLVDSYVEQSYAGGTWSHFTGSIVGDAAGDIINVYSNATMVSPCHYTSGIVGIMRPASVEGETVAINNCWFDGTIELTKEVGYIGGIVGYQENGTLNLTNVLYTGHIKGDRPTADKYGIGGIIGQTYNTVTATNLESVVSAGTFDIPNGTKWIGSVVGYFYSGVDETDTSTYTLNNVFANRGWGTTSSWGGGNGTLTGQVIQTSNGDRLIGYVPQVARDIENNNLLDAQKLDFTSAWTMRTNDVPIPTALKDVVDVRTIVSDATIATLTNELGLGTISGSLSNSVAEGAGDYLVTVAGTKSNYDGYLSQLKTLGFTKYADNAGTTMEADGIYSATYTKAATDNVGEWVVNVTFVTNDGKLYVSINSDVDSVAKTLLNDDTKNPIGAENGTNAVSLSMVEDKEAINITGNCFVFQLPNGHFIINDGNTDGGAGAILKAYLQSQVGEGNPIIIDAWTISHFHNDHAGALMDFAKDASLRENVYLNALYANEPSAYGATIYETRTIGDINGAIQGAKLLTKSPTDNSAPDFYEVHMGQRYYFNGVTMDVVNTPEQIPVDTWTGGEKTVETHTPDPFNTSSVNFVFTLSESGKRVLLGGDSTKITMQYVIDAYGTNNNTLANINVFAAYHHGKNAMNQYNFNNGSSYYPTSNKDGYVNAGKANNGWAEFLLNNTQNSSNKFDVMLFPFVKKFSTYKHTSTSTEDYYLGQYKNVYVGDDGSVIYPWNIGEINKYYADNSNLHLTTGYEDSTSATEANPHGTVKITFNADGQISHTVYNTVHGQETYTFETFVPTSGDGTVVPDEEL